MFTGLVEAKGIVVSRIPATESTRLVIEAGEVAADASLGDSIAINGCCLTVIAREQSRLTFDLLAETERCTNLKEVRPGSEVNLERALRADSRLGGHFVTGHIDTTGTIRRWEKVDADYELEVELGQKEQSRYLIAKGCIAVDGISLTVGTVAPGRFTVWIIPHTRQVTALGARQVGDALNLEFDLLAKYAEKLLSVPRI